MQKIKRRKAAVHGRFQKNSGRKSGKASSRKKLVKPKYRKPKSVSRASIVSRMYSEILQLASKPDKRITARTKPIRRRSAKSLLKTREVHGDSSLRFEERSRQFLLARKLLIFGNDLSTAGLESFEAAIKNEVVAPFERFFLNRRWQDSFFRIDLLMSSGKKEPAWIGFKKQNFISVDEIYPYISEQLMKTVQAAMASRGVMIIEKTYLKGFTLHETHTIKNKAARNGKAKKPKRH